MTNVEHRQNYAFGPFQFSGGVLRVFKRRAELSQIYDQSFERMWEFYLAGSEMSFRYDGFMVFQAQRSHSIDSVPMTRDDMVNAERAPRLDLRVLVAADATVQ